MPDQNSAVKTGDTITADQIIALPVGAIVSDRDGDLYRQNEDGTWSRKFDTPDEYVVKSDSHTAGIRGYFAAHFAPYTLSRLPRGPVADGAPDLYQQARIALRDRTGTEPDIEHVHQVARIMEDRGLTPAAAVSAWQLAEIATLPDHIQPAARFGDPTVEIVPTPQEDKIYERARAFAQSYLTMDRDRLAAIDKVKQLDEQLDHIAAQPLLSTISRSNPNRYLAILASMQRAHQELDAAKNDERIEAWNTLMRHTYFTELMADTHDDDRTWSEVLADHFTALHTSRTAPAETQAAAARMAPPWSRGFGIAVSRDGVGHAATIDADDSGPAGIARLRAHSALDGLLDQAGVSR